MKYTVKIIKNKSEIEACQKFSVSNYNWGGEYRTKTEGAFALIENEGFFLKMTCFEKNPLKTYTNINDPVYKDSCMEAFIAFYPNSEKGGYINFEMNANGAILASYRTKRSDRVHLTDFGLTPPRPEIFIGDEAWSLELFIPLSLLKAVYGSSDFKNGQVLKGNFFKVCETAPFLQYASFAPINTEKPDFHLPEFFVQMVIEK